MPKFATGKYAHGFCDRCGFRVKFSDMKTESVAGNPVNIKVCPSCFDAEQPQEMLGKWPVHDPQALRNARPDTSLEASRVIPDNPTP